MATPKEEFVPARGEQLTSGQLRWAEWWVTHRAGLGRVGTVALGVLGGALFLYGAYGFTDWLFLSGPRERASIATLAESQIDFAAFRAARAPAQIGVTSPTVLFSGSGAYDLIAQVTNANADWVAEFSYRFVWSGGATEPVRGVALPGDTAYLLGLGVRSTGAPAGARVELVEFAWKRVDRHVVQPDYATWAGERLALTVSAVAFDSPRPDAPVTVPRARFTVRNDTAYGYRLPTFVVLLRGAGGQLLGANATTIDRLRAGETRTLEASWFHDVGTPSRVEVVPVVNIFDEDAYLKPGE